MCVCVRLQCGKRVWSEMEFCGLKSAYRVLSANESNDLLECCCIAFKLVNFVVLEDALMALSVEFLPSSTMMYKISVP